jgi:hypothetical protein
VGKRLVGSYRLLDSQPRVAERDAADCSEIFCYIAAVSVVKDTVKYISEVLWRSRNVFAGDCSEAFCYITVVSVLNEIPGAIRSPRPIGNLAGIRVRFWPPFSINYIGGPLFALSASSGGASR